MTKQNPLSDKAIETKGCMTPLIYFALVLYIIMFIVCLPLALEGDWLCIFLSLLGAVGTYVLIAKLKDRKKATVQTTENARTARPVTADPATENSDSYNAVETAATNLFKAIKDMDDMPAVTDIMDTQKKQLSGTSLIGLTVNKYLGFIALSDVLKCYKGLGYSVDSTGMENMGLLIFTLELMHRDAFKTVGSEKLMKEQGVEYASNFIKIFDSSFMKDFPEDRFLTVDLLRKGNIGEDIINKYIRCLLHFTSVLAGLNGPVSESASALIARIAALSQKPNKLEINYNDETKGTTVSIVINNLPENAEIRIDR